MPFTAVLSFVQRLFGSAPSDALAEIPAEGESSAPMSDQELSRTIKELRDSPMGGALRNGGRAGDSEEGDR